MFSEGFCRPDRRGDIKMPDCVAECRMPDTNAVAPGDGPGNGVEDRSQAMASIVRLALSRPYTFIVMSILILIFGVMSILRTPTDIFPRIGIPVISVVWQYAGLPPDYMSGRIISVFERSLTTTVNDIEHVESQSVPATAS